MFRPSIPLALLLVVLGAISASLPGRAAAQSLGTAPPVALEARLSTPLVPAGQTTTAYLRVKLDGRALEMATRPPMNVAIVIDKSGSMQGQKIERAREAARRAVDKLAPDDIVSIVAYDTTVRVVAPATKASDKGPLYAGIRSIEAGGDTALFAGVTKGAAEVRKFRERGRVNRVILLSDGLANVGPSTPSELGALGATLMREGISVTTFGLGLGYNEDLMTSLSRQSDGNHAFIEDAADLSHFFDLELGTAAAVVANDIEIRLDCGDGVRPLRVVGRPAEIVGSHVTTSMNQIYAGQSQQLVLEVELAPGLSGESRRVSHVQVTYGNLAARTTEQLETDASASFTGDRMAVENATDRDVMVSAIEQIANEQNVLAVNLRDRGNVDEARTLLRKNAAYLDDNNRRYKAPSLLKLKTSNEEDSENLEGDNWNRQRKAMRKKQLQTELQQMY